MFFLGKPGFPIGGFATLTLVMPRNGTTMRALLFGFWHAQRAFDATITTTTSIQPSSGCSELFPIACCALCVAAKGIDGVTWPRPLRQRIGFAFVFFFSSPTWATHFTQVLGRLGVLLNRNLDNPAYLGGFVNAISAGRSMTGAMSAGCCGVPDRWGWGAGLCGDKTWASN